MALVACGLLKDFFTFLIPITRDMQKVTPKNRTITFPSLDLNFLLPEIANFLQCQSTADFVSCCYEHHSESSSC